MSTPTNQAEATQQHIVDTLLGDAYMQEHEVSFVAENRLDIDALIDEAMGRTGICGTVLTPAIEYGGRIDETQIAGVIPELIISFAESPNNRARANACTGLDAAIRAAQILNSPTILLKTIRQAVDDQQGLIITNITFKTMLTIALITNPEG